MLAHETGHHIWHNLSPAQQELIFKDKKIQKLSTPTTIEYSAFINEKRGQGPISPILERKLFIEQVAEAIRLYFVKGEKFTSLENIFKIVK